MPSKYEEQYFIGVYKESYTSILSYITSKCSEPSDIEDLVQEVYTEFYSRIKKHGFSDLDNPGGFLMTIAKRKVVRYYKLKKKSFEMLNDINDLSEDKESDAAEASVFENGVVNKILLEKIWNEIAFEGNTVLQIFQMRHYKDMTFKQIAAKLVLSEATVINNYYKTLYKLKKITWRRKHTKMEIEELVKLALVNHDINQEKIMSNVLKKERRHVAVKKAMVSIGVSVLLAIPILTLSFSFAKNDTLLPTAVSDTANVSVIDPSEISSNHSSVSYASDSKRKIIVAQIEDVFFEGETLISDKLSKAFEAYDEDTEFLICTRYVASLDYFFSYFGKTINELQEEVDK